MRATAQTAIAVIGIARISDHVARTKLNRPGLQSSSRPVGIPPVQRGGPSRGLAGHLLQSGTLAGTQRLLVTRLRQCHCDRCGDADGELAHADCTKNADLFWASRVAF